MLLAASRLGPGSGTLPQTFGVGRSNSEETFSEKHAPLLNPCTPFGRLTSRGSTCSQPRARIAQHIAFSEGSSTTFAYLILVLTQKERERRFQACLCYAISPMNLLRIIKIWPTYGFN